MIRFLLITCFIFFQTTNFAQDHDAELIVQETNIIINNSKLTKEIYYEIKINNRAGEKYTKITIPYSKLIKVSNIDAYIKDTKGIIVKKLKKSEIVEKSSISNISFYEDDYVKEFTLKHNSYPYSIIYSYQIQQNEFLQIEDWIPIIDEEVPTLSANLRVSVPLDYKMAFINPHVNNPKIDTLEDMIYYQWHTSYIDLFKPEVLSSPITDLLPLVTIIPYEFNYEKKGSFKDWISYGNWQYELLQGINELPDSEKSKILTLIKDVKEDQEKIKILYHYLQDYTRYINITIETGGLKPYPASYVALNKYGDCKALTNYFKSILDYVGIKSFYSIIYAGNPIVEINKNFPSQQFNHVILFIPQNDDDIWLDCTSDGAYNYLGTFTQNRDAFIICKNSSYFLKTPALNTSDVLETRRIEISYKVQKEGLTFENIYTGSKYETILYLDNNYNETEKSKIINNYFLNDGVILNDYHLFKFDRDSAKIKFLYEATSQNIYKHYGNEIFISNIPFSIPHFEKPEHRKFPLQIDYPFYMIDTIIYETPVGYKLKTDNVEYTVSSRFGNYKYNVFEEKGEIMVIKSLIINSGIYAISLYEDFYNFYKQIIDIENKTNLSLKKNF